MLRADREEEKKLRNKGHKPKLVVSPGVTAVIKNLSSTIFWANTEKDVRMKIQARWCCVCEMCGKDKN